MNYYYKPEHKLYHINSNLYNSFFGVLSSTNQKSWYTNEIYYRNQFGFKSLSDENLEILRTKKNNNNNKIN